jgi:class 3 adenylate cyclase
MVSHSPSVVSPSSSIMRMHTMPAVDRERRGAIDEHRRIGNGVAMEVPDVRFTRIGDDRIAYQIFGDGPPDLIIAASTDALDARWEWPPYAHFLRRLASFSRVILFDRRGSGASDLVSREGGSVWEDWAEDARAVLDAVESERAVVWGGADSGPTAILFAATEPERTQSLVLYTTTARFAAADDYPVGNAFDTTREVAVFILENWGTERTAVFASRTAAQDPAFRRWFAKSQRIGSSPRQGAETVEMAWSMDVRQILPSVHSPTLVIHRRDTPYLPVEHARYLADHLPDARLLLVDGDTPMPFVEPVEEALVEVEAFVTGTRSRATATNRVLATVMFTDIVGSSERATAEGDRRWRTLLESHDALVRGVVEQSGGRVVKTMGDGMLATFDGPGRAVQCARSLRDALRTLAVEIRTGIHTGEIEVRGDDISGIGVHVAARVNQNADPGQIWVSGVVPLLMTGSDVEFQSRGEWALKGIPGAWELYEVKG